MIGIRHEENPVLDPLMELRIGTNNQPVLTISIGVAKALKALKWPTVEEVITITAAYNVGGKRTPQRIRSTGVDGSTPVTSVNRDVDGSGIGTVCPSPPPCAPPSILWNKKIGNIWKTTTPNIRDTNELTSPIDRILNNDTIAPSITSQIIGGEFSNISSFDLYSRCRMNFTADTGQPVAPQFLNHGIPTIVTLDEKCSIWIHYTIIIRTPNITNRSASEHAVGQGTAVGDAVED